MYQGFEYSFRQHRERFFTLPSRLRGGPRAYRLWSRLIHDETCEVYFTWKVEYFLTLRECRRFLFDRYQAAVYPEFPKAHVEYDISECLG